MEAIDVLDHRAIALFRLCNIIIKDRRKYYTGEIRVQKRLKTPHNADTGCKLGTATNSDERKNSKKGYFHKNKLDKE